MDTTEIDRRGAGAKRSEASGRIPGPHDLGVLYSCSFPLSHPGGKSAGTRRKLAALGRLARTLIVVAPGPAGGVLFKLLALVSTEARTVALLVRRRNEIDVYISRAMSGMPALFVARLLGIRTAREIHADSLEEAAILAPHDRFKRRVLRFTATVTHGLDRAADIRFFNHPALLRWYADSGWQGPCDIAVYNGGQVPGIRISRLEQDRVRKRLSLPANHSLLVFTGSASPWHGIEFLVELQKCFNRHGDPVRILCAGGAVQHIDPTGLLLNRSPAGEAECEQYIQSADFCLLPVRGNRRSPGSPIKLFDYLMHRKYVITQKQVEGYSDVAEAFGAGILVDFRDAEGTRARILEAIRAGGERQVEISETALQSITWEARMDAWLQAVERSKMDSG